MSVPNVSTSKTSIDRLALENMLVSKPSNPASNNTDMIRTLKHSSQIRDNILTLVDLRERISDPTELHERGILECYFLFEHYPDIYNRVRKNTINTEQLLGALDLLKQIEDGVIDQHEGSVQFGMILKRIYLDSAIQQADKLKQERIAQGLDTDEDATSPATKQQPRSSLSYKEWKQLHSCS